jgi:hypothetical protein
MRKQFYLFCLSHYIIGGAKATKLSRQASMGNENELHYALLQRKVACQKFLEGAFRDERIFLCFLFVCVGSADTSTFCG